MSTKCCFSLPRGNNRAELLFVAEGANSQVFRTPKIIENGSIMKILQKKVYPTFKMKMGTAFLSTTSVAISTFSLCCLVEMMPIFIMKVGYINPRKIFITCSFSKLFGVLKRWEFPLALPNVSAHKQNVWRYFFCNTVPKSLFQTGTIPPLPREWAPWKYIIIADTSYGISKIEKYKHKLCPHPVSCQTCEN